MFDTPRVVNDYLRNYMDMGLTLRVDAKVQLMPPNMIGDPSFTQIQGDGAPFGARFFRGPRNDGYHVYGGKPEGDQATLSRQTFSPINPEDDSFPFDRAIFGGSPVPKPSQLIADLAVRPEKAYVSLRDVDKLGFPQGDYWGCISYVGKGGSHTMTTVPVKFTVTGSGRYIEVPIPPEVPDHVDAIGIWLSEPDGEWDTIRLQAVKKRTGPTAILFGPYNMGGRKRPEKNETQVGRASRPEWGRPRRRDLWRANAMHDLQPMSVRIAIVEFTRIGDGLPSVHSEQRVIKGRTRRVKERSRGEEEDGAPEGDKTGAEKTVVEPIRNEGIYVLPDSHHPESVGYKVFVSISFDDGATRIWYQLVQPGRVWKDKGWKFEDVVGVEDETDNRRRRGDRFHGIPVIYGYIDSGDGSTTGGGGLPKHLRYMLVQADPPTEDASGIESPTGEADAFRSIGVTRPQPGPTWFTYTRVINGRQSLAAEPTKMDIPEAVDGFGNPLGVAASIPVLHFPALVNKIPNSLFRRLDQQGNPEHWTVDETGGQVIVEEPGVVRLSTNAPIGNNALTPYLQTEEFIELDAERVETLRGNLRVNTRGAAGTAKIGLIQYDVDDTTGAPVLVAGSEDASSISLTSVDLQGTEISFAKKIGPVSDGADVALHPEAQLAKLKIYAHGNGRSIDFSVWGIAWHPFDAMPRKIVAAEAGSLAPSLPTFDPAVPYPTGHVWAITIPPEVQGTDATSTPPIDVVSFDSTLGGLTAVENPNNANTLTALNAGKLRTMSDHTSSKSFCYAWREIPDWLDIEAGGSAVTLTLTRIPTLVNGSTSVLSLYSAEGTPRRVAAVFVKNTGTANAPRATIILRAYPETSKAIERTIASGLLVGQTVYLDLVAGYGGGQDTVSLTYAIDAGTRRAASPIFAGDLPGFAPGELRLGADDVSDRRVKYTYDFDNLRITERGDVPEAPATPPLTSMEQPDWPMRDGSLLSQTSGTIDYPGASPPQRATLAIEYAFTPTTTPTVVTQLVRLDDSAGVQRAELVETATGHVEVRSPHFANRQVETPLGNGVQHKVELVATGGGTKGGTISVYRQRSGGERELIYVKGGLDWSTIYPSRVRTFTRAGITANVSKATSRGVLEPIDQNADGSPIYQGYGFINKFDVLTDDRLGMEFEEEFVRPGVEQVFAIRLAYSNASEGNKPFNVVLYNERGERYVAARVLGDAGTAEGGEGWVDRAVFYTPEEGYYRMRVENEDMSDGIYRFQQPFSHPALADPDDLTSRLDTEAKRDAQRAKGRSTKGEMSYLLTAEIPDKAHASRVIDPDYDEEWLRLLAYGDLPTGAELSFTSDPGTDTLIVDGGHRYLDGGIVQLAGDDLPAPLVDETTYFVRDVNAAAGTLKLAAIEGGAAIDITQLKTGTIFGMTAIEPQYRSTNQEPPVTWSAWMNDPADLPQDVRYADVWLVLRGSGEQELTPTIAPGQIELVYKQFQPSFYKEDGSPFPGGTIAFGLLRDAETSDLDTAPVAGYPRRRRTTDVIRKIEEEFRVDFHHPDALVDFKQRWDRGENFRLDHAASNSTFLIEPYEIGEVEYEESELLEETIGWLRATIPFTRSRVIEAHTLIPEEEFAGAIP